VFFGVFPLGLFRVVSTSANDCLERLVSEMIYYLSSGLGLGHCTMSLDGMS